MARTEVREKRKTRKWITVLFSIVLALVLIAAIVVLGVYRGMSLYLMAELGEGAPEASAFMKSDAKASYVKEPDISLKTEGTYLLMVKTDDGRRPVLLVVRDTEAPKAKAKNPNITIDDKSLKPEDALTKISDASDYTVKWKTEPIYGKAGSYECSVLLCDAHGNERTVKTTVNVLGLIDVLTYEAGTAHPTLEDFMVVERDNAELITDLDKINWDKPGDNKVEAKLDGKTYSSILRIVDTVEPVPDLAPVAVLQNSELSAEDFVLSCVDATKVSYKLDKQPDTSEKGTFSCTVKATDLGENTVKLKSKYIVCDALCEFEASTDMLSESEVLKQLGEEYSGFTMKTEPFMLNSLGAHEVVFEKGEESASVGVTVVDTTAPTADGIECQCSLGYPCDAIKFVQNIADFSTVRASFAVEPDWDEEGEQEVEIILTDRAGNETTVDAAAVISPDTAGPAIYGVHDYCVYVGDDISDFKEVYAIDNADPKPELTADTSQVDADTAGEYEVIYTAKDREGNESTATVKFTFIEKTVDEDKLNAEVDKVLGEILKDGMSAEEKAYAIFDYVYTNIKSGTSQSKTDWMAEAYRGLTEGTGDSFTCYSVSYALLRHVDCKLLSLSNSAGNYWCLVNLGTGWYHFDANSSAASDVRLFMKTSAELDAINSSRWSFNATAYPDTATIPYAMKNA